MQMAARRALYSLFLSVYSEWIFSVNMKMDQDSTPHIASRRIRGAVRLICC